jgi:protease I
MVPFRRSAPSVTTLTPCPGRRRASRCGPPCTTRGRPDRIPRSGHNFALNATFDAVNERDYDAGHSRRAPEYPPQPARDRGRETFRAQEHKPIAAICHGAQLLAAANVIRGKRISAYPACSPEVELAGGNARIDQVDAAVTDGNFVTAPAWAGPSRLDRTIPGTARHPDRARASRFARNAMIAFYVMLAGILLARAALWISGRAVAWRLAPPPVWAWPSCSSSPVGRTSPGRARIWWMVPPQLPSPHHLVTLTGIAELAGALDC